MKLPAFRPHSSWVAPTSLPSWKDAQRIGYDLETRDPDLRELGPGVRTNGYITGFSIAIEGGPAFYLPIAHKGGGNLDAEQVKNYIRDNAAQFKGEVVGANLQYDMDYSAQQGIWFPHATWRDVQVAEPILDELQLRYGLDAIMKRRGLSGKDEAVLTEFATYYGVNPKSDMWMLPACAVGRYAEADAVGSLQLLRRQEREIESQNLWNVYDLECRLQPVLMKMRRRGVRVDLARVEGVESLSLSREVKALAEISRLTGIRLTTADTTKSSALIPVVRHLGFTIPKTQLGNDSLVNDYLAGLDDASGVCKLIREAKKWNKVRNTFCASIRRHEVRGRIHCTFNQMVGESDSGDSGGARYGRLSCRLPNCFSEDTEVLTPGGWARIADLSAGEPVAELRGDSLVFSQPLHHHAYPYDGEMVSVRGRYSDLLMTPNHRCFTVSARGEQKWFQADEYRTLGLHYQLHSAVLAGGQPCGRARIAAMVQADGSLHSRQFRIQLSKDGKVKRCRELLEGAGIGFSYYYYPSTHTPHVFSFRVETIADYFSDLKSKTFSNRVMGLDKTSRDAFLDELAYWDGTSAGDWTFRYFTTNRINMELVSGLVAMSGRRMSCRESYTRTGKPFFDARIGRLDRTRTHGLVIGREHYSGSVHCLTMPSGTLLVRRNWKTSITGNCQQQPARDPEIGPMWRSIYRPDPGAEWVSLDYGTVEPRWAVHYAALKKLPGAEQALGQYVKDPSTDFHQMVADLMGVARKPAKEIGLGTMYGMGGAKLAHKLGLPTVKRVHSRGGGTYEAAGPEAQKLMDLYDESLPFLRGLAQMCEKTADKHGFIMTAGGRRCRFPVVNGKYDWTFKALNRLVQGSSGDQMKMAMVLMDEAGIPIQLQVHDEVDLSGDLALAQKGAEIMLHALPCSVPHRVDIEMGPSWGEIEKV